MTRLLKQSTAFTFRIGPFLDELDGRTAETALSLVQADYRVSKNGGAFAQKNDATAGTHDENGWYTCVLNATDTNTLGTLRVAVHKSGALPVWEIFQVVPANIYDSLIAGTARQNVNTDSMSANSVTATAIASNAITSAKIASGAITSTQIAASAIGATQIASNAITSAKIAADAVGATQIAADAITAAKIAADAIGASELAADAVNEIADQVWDEATIGHTTGGTFGKLVDDVLTDTADMQPKLGAPAGASMSADIAAIQTDTDDIQTRLPAALVGGRMDSNVQAMANDVVTAAAIAADAIGASELAADAVTEIQTGLATAAALATVQADTDDIQTRLPAALVGGRMDSSVGAMATDVVTAAAIAADAIGASELATDAVNEIRDAIATQLGMIRANTAQAGAAGSITLDASADANDDFYNRCWVVTTGGTGAGQCRYINDYDGTSKVATTEPNWITNPDATTTFSIIRAAPIDLANDSLDSGAVAVSGAQEIRDQILADSTPFNGADIASVTQIADGILDRTDGVEPASGGTERTVREALRLILAATAGKLSGAPGGPILIRDTNDTKDRINATVDASGNRSAVTLDDT